MTVNSSIAAQLISCTIGCLGVCFWYNSKGRQFVANGVGAFLTWAVDIIVHDLTGSNLIATFTAAVFVATFAEIMARTLRAPSTIFLTSGAFPLVPGASLYNCMYNAVQENFTQAAYNLFQVIAVAMAIALGFIVVSIFRRYFVFAARYRKHKKRLKQKEREKKKDGTNAMQMTNMTNGKNVTNATDAMNPKHTDDGRSHEDDRPGGGA